MVGPCKCLEVDEEELVRKYVSERRGASNRRLYRDFMPTWLEAIQSYVKNEGNPEEVLPVGVEDVLADKLKRLYKKPSGTAKAIKDELKEHGLQHCPFCGEMGRPNTLDHYLPKEFFPEFSIAPTNLVPMCDKCQTKKGSDYVNEGGEKLFLHPYFDCKGIVINLKMHGDFEPLKSMDLFFESEDGVETVCRTHIKRLDIESRFGKFFSTRYVNIVMIIEERLSQKGDNTNLLIRAYLDTIRRIAERESVNHWDAIIYRSLLRSDEWIDYMTTKCLDYRG